MISQHTLPRVTQANASNTLPGNRAHKSAHLVGICGSGMKALAELLLGQGWTITGSDLQFNPSMLPALRQRGLRVHPGHSSRFVSRNVDFLVYSPAVNWDNPERQLARRSKIPEKSYSQMLGHLMSDRVGVCVAGTHGKSTTTAMVGTILECADLSPSAVVGAELIHSGVSGWAGTGNLFVVESCEYQRSFLDLTPHIAAILNIEPDHFDYYPNLSAALDAYCEFVARLPGDGVLLIPSGCAQARSTSECTLADVETFSANEKADWWATDLRRTSCGTRFRIFYRGRYYCEVSLRVEGQHNVFNGLAAAALAHHAGASPADVSTGLREFLGVRRRFEYTGSWRGVTLIDDFAHHPTAVQLTLKTARERFGRRRIWCAFQPHQISRTRALMDEFSKSFGAADHVLLTPIYAAREAQSELADPTLAELAARVNHNGPPTRLMSCLDQLVSTLEDETRPGDVLITMGAGDISRVQHEFTRRLQRNHSA